MDSFMNKFSRSNRPPITPQQMGLDGNSISSDTNTSAGKKAFAPSVESLFKAATENNVSNDGLGMTQSNIRKGSSSKVTFDDNEGNIRRMITQQKIKGHNLTPGRSAQSSSALQNLLNEDQSHEKQKTKSKSLKKDAAKVGSEDKMDRKQSNLSLMFENATETFDNFAQQYTDTNVDNSRAQKKSWKANRNRKSINTNNLTDGKTKRSMKKKQISDDKTYVEYPKVDSLDTPSTFALAPVNSENNSSDTLERPTVICCQYSLDKKESMRADIAETNGVSEQYSVNSENDSSVILEKAKVMDKKVPTLADIAEPKELSQIAPKINSHEEVKVDMKKGEKIGGKPGDQKPNEDCVENEVNAKEVVQINLQQTLLPKPSESETSVSISAQELVRKESEVPDYEGSLASHDTLSENKEKGTMVTYITDEERVVQKAQIILSREEVKLHMNKHENVDDNPEGQKPNEHEEDVIQQNMQLNMLTKQSEREISVLSSTREKNSKDDELPDYEDSIIIQDPLLGNKDAFSDIGSLQRNLERQSTVDLDNSAKINYDRTIVTDDASKKLAPTPLCCPEITITSSPGRVKENVFVHPNTDNTTLTEDFTYCEWAKLVREIKSNDPIFAPVDVAKSKSLVYVTSQATNTVAVFENDIYRGVIKFNNRKLFNSPHNIIYIPPYCCTTDDFQDPRILKEDFTNIASSKLKMANAKSSHVEIFATGCIIVLDNDGFHVFSEQGVFITTLMKGLGHKYRGLATHYKEIMEGNVNNFSSPTLQLLTVDISDTKAAYLCLINLEKSLFLALNYEITNIDAERIKIQPTEQNNGFMDQRIKCRFIASSTTLNNKKMFDNTFAPSGGCMEEVVYVSGMMSKLIYSVNIKTKESKIMRLKQRTSSIPIDLTFAEQPMRNCNIGDATFVTQASFTTTPFTLLKPTGIQVDDKGNFLIADNLKNEVYVFDPTGLLIKAIVCELPDKKEINAAVGISLDHDNRHLYVCSNKSKNILKYQI